MCRTGGNLDARATKAENIQKHIWAFNIEPYNLGQAWDLSYTYISMRKVVSSQPRRYFSNPPPTLPTRATHRPAPPQHFRCLFLAFALGSMERISGEPAVNSRDPMEAACPMQMVQISGRTYCIVS